MSLYLVYTVMLDLSYYDEWGPKLGLIKLVLWA